MGVIRAGTYKFNDVLTGFPTDQGFDIVLDFTVQGDFYWVDGDSYAHFDPEGITTFYKMHVDEYGDNLYYGTDDEVDLGSYYNAEYGWQIAYFKMAVVQQIIPELINHGKIITVLKDAEVTDEGSNWFYSNVKLLVGYASYNDADIADLCVGQTVTIKCKGKVMKDDIVIKL